MPASIAKLSIRGVRSFSPDNDDQIIEFYFPLTIIVGANGCGKTTIIECLRYAITGGLPPGNKSGQAFVHDPKHSKTSVVKASVKVRCNDVRSNTLVVHRTMEVSQKKSTTTFKSLDGVILSSDENGRTVSNSHTCSELDKTIPILLGISKAVLDNVVFVHQEDSCWVLQEGAVLKTKFDAIFDSTKYAKALEAIKETKKRYTNKVKDLKVDLASLQGHKHAANNFRLELDQANASLSKVTDEIQDLQKNIEDEVRKKTAISKILSEVGCIDQEIRDKTHQIEKERVRLETIKSNLKEDMTSRSLAELENLLKEFDVSTGSMLNDLEEKRDYADEIKAAIAALQKREHELIQRKGIFIGEKLNYENDLKRRVEIITEILTKYDLKYDQTQASYREGSFIDLGTQRSLLSQGSVTTLGRLTVLSQESTVIVTEDELAAIQRMLADKHNELSVGLSMLRKEQQNEDDKLQKVIGEMMTDARSIDSELQKCIAEREKAARELQILSRTPLSCRTRQSDIDDAKKNYQDVIKLRDDALNDNKRVTIPIEIAQTERKIDDLRNSVEDDKRALAELRTSAEVHNEINLLSRQIQSDLQNLIDVKKQNTILYEKFNFHAELSLALNSEELGNATQNLFNDVAKRDDNNNSDLSDVRHRVRLIESRLSQVTADLNHNRKVYSEKMLRHQHLLKGAVENIKHVIDSINKDASGDQKMKAESNPKEIIQYLTDLMAEAEIDSPRSISRTIKKLKRLRKTDKRTDNGEDAFVCPCCQQVMDKDTASVFNASMDSLADLNNSKLILQDKINNDEQRAYLESLEALRTQASQNSNEWDECKRLSEELVSMKEILSEKIQQEESTKNELDSEQGKERRLEQDQRDLRHLLDVSRQLADEAGKISRKMNQVDSMKSKLSLSAPTAGGRDLRTLENELANKMQVKDDLSASISKLNRDLSLLNDTINQRSKAVSENERKLRETEERFTKEQESNDRRSSLTDSMSKFQLEENRLNNELLELRQKLKVKENERSRIRASAETSENKASSKLNDFKVLFSKFDELTVSINLFIQSKKIESLNNLEADMAKLSDEMKTNHTKLKENEPVIEMLKTKLNDKQGMRDNVSKNIDLKKMYDKILTLEKEKNELEVKISCVEGYKTAEIEIQKSRQNILKYTSEKDRRDGISETYKSHMRELKRKLRTPEYDDVDERHRVKMIECEVSSLAVSDLEKYYSALDKALLRYHGMKIAEINKIIAELWALTYKGEDITSIRITSDQEEGSKASRSYNYRVVMTKGNVELDMRGRCSAGQRVLASIVIRLALAETFCLSFGVMALDEPTTNLDFANKRGLAAALAQIISTRAAQKNFQLIIITHDEEFVSQMKIDLATHSGLSMPEKYFVVSREEASDGCFYSKIHRVDWDEI